MTRESVCAIVPAFNEQESVGRVVTALLLYKVASLVVVVDDHSTDGTVRAAATAGASRRGRTEVAGDALRIVAEPQLEFTRSGRARPP